MSERPLSSSQCFYYSKTRIFRLKHANPLELYKCKDKEDLEKEVIIRCVNELIEILINDYDKNFGNNYYLEIEDSYFTYLTSPKLSRDFKISLTYAEGKNQPALHYLVLESISD